MMILIIEPVFIPKYREYTPERTLWLISIQGDKNSYLEYPATLCKIIIWLNKATTIKCQGQVSKIHVIKGLDPWILRLLL